MMINDKKVLDLSRIDISSAISARDEVGEIVKVPEDLTCSEWCEKHYRLAPESTNTSGPWVTKPDQLAILNSMGSDAIEVVAVMCPTRYGKTVMQIGVHNYMIGHKRRNLAFYQPTQADSTEFVKSQIEPHIRDCQIVYDAQVSKSDTSKMNTQSFKSFVGCNAYYKGGHSAKSYERMTLDTVMIDEYDLFNDNIDGRGDPGTLSWSRVKNSVFKKQIFVSKPTIKGASKIEKEAKSAEDLLIYHVECPLCGVHSPIEWGGKDLDYGFKWVDRDASTVKHFCKHCGEGWDNGHLFPALKTGYWQGENGYKTIDGISWTKNGESCSAPRKIGFWSWSGYSTYVTWSQLVEEWYDAIGNTQKIQAFNNNALCKTWDIESVGTITQQFVDNIVATSDVSQITAITVGVDVQDDRLEAQYIGHDDQRNVYVMDYEREDCDPSNIDSYRRFLQHIAKRKWEIGEKTLRPCCIAIDTQGHHTTTVHEVLKSIRKKNGDNSRVIGINGSATCFTQISDKPGQNKNVTGSKFYTIGTNVLKKSVYDAIRNCDKDENGFRIYDKADLPLDYGKQLTVEKIKIKRDSNGKDRFAFEAPAGARNEALDTFVYALAAKYYLIRHRVSLGRNLFKNG